MALAELTEENKPNSLNCSNKTFFIHCYKFSHDYDLYIPGKHYQKQRLFERKKRIPKRNKSTLICIEVERSTSGQEFS